MSAGPASVILYIVHHNVCKRLPMCLQLISRVSQLIHANGRMSSQTLREGRWSLKSCEDTHACCVSNTQTAMPACPIMSAGPASNSLVTNFTVPQCQLANTPRKRKQTDPCKWQDEQSDNERKQAELEDMWSRAHLLCQQFSDCND